MGANVYSWMMIATIVLYVILESRLGMKKALVAAIAMCILWVGMTFAVFGELDWITGLEVGLLLGAALASWKTQSAMFFRFQPVVVGVIMGAICLVTQWMGKPIIVEMLNKYAPKMVNDPAQLEMLLSPMMQAGLVQYNFWAGIAFLVHAALLVWAALRLSTAWWGAIRIVGFYVFQIAALILAFATSAAA